MSTSWQPAQASPEKREVWELVKKSKLKKKVITPSTQEVGPRGPTIGTRRTASLADSVDREEAARAFRKRRDEVLGSLADYNAVPFVDIGEVHNDIKGLDKQVSGLKAPEDIEEKTEQLGKVYEKFAKQVKSDHKKSLTAWNEYQERRQSALQLLDEAKASSSCSFDKVEAQIAVIEQDVRAAKGATETAARAKNGKGELKPVIEFLEAAVEICSLLDKANKGLKRLESNPLLPPKEIEKLQALIVDADAGLAQATEVKDLPPIKSSIEVDFKKARAALLKKFKVERKAWRKYKKARKQAKDRLAVVRKSRFADPKPLADLIKFYDKDVRDLAKKGKSAATLKGLKEASDALEKAAKEAEGEAENLNEEGKKKYRDDLKAIPKYEKRLAKARKDRAALNGLAGAGEQRAALDKLIEDAEKKIVPGTGRTGMSGYAEALGILKGSDALMKEAQEASANFHPTLSPQATKAYQRAKAELEKLEQIAAVEVSAPFAVQLTELYEKAGRSEELVDGDLEALAKKITLEVGNQEGLKDSCKAKIDAFVLGLNKVETLVPKERRERLQAALESAWKRSTEKRYSSALSLLTGVDAHLQELTRISVADKKAWDVQEPRRMELLERTKQLAKDPTKNRLVTLRTRATIVFQAMQKLEIETPENCNFAWGVAEASRIEQEFDEFYTSIEELFPQYDGLDKALPEFDKALAEAEKSVESAAAKAKEALEKLAGLLGPAVARKTESPLHRRRDAATEAWANFLLNPQKAADGAPLMPILKYHKDEAIAEFRAIAAEADKLASNRPALQQYTEEARKEQALETNRARVQEIEALLEALQTAGADTTDLRGSLAHIPITTNPECADRLEELKKKVDKASAEQAKKVENQQKQARGQQKNIQKKVAEALKKNQKFKSYFDGLAAEVEDAEAMIATGNPELIAQAQQYLERLNGQVDQVLAKGPDSYPRVKETWKELSEMLGNDFCIKLMAQTHARLKAELERAIIEAKGLPPDEALARIEAMRRPIEKLYEATMAQRSEYVRFKQRRKDVKAKQKLLKSKITDDTSHYYQRIAYLYKKAKLASREEGHLAQAHDALDDLEKQMDEILAAEDPREALQTKDAEVTRDLSDLKQMVETWIASYEQYQAVVKEAVTAVGKATASGDGDFSQITDLRKAGKAIGKPLEKYLKRYDKVKPPTKWFKEGRAPTLIDAERVFLRAHSELDQLMRRARQVIANPGGNKVRCRRKLPKAHQEWIATAQRFVQAVREMAQQIQADAAADPKPSVRIAGPKVYNRLVEVADGFDPLGFTDAVKDLTEPTSSDAKRKAAREAGMRLVRRLHDEIYRAPLVVTITDKANPFARIFTHTSDLLVALKRMEIEILTAV